MFADLRWLREAIELSRCCPVSLHAYSVGAIIVDARGDRLSDGYSREKDEHVHAEESALVKLRTADSRLHGATIYSSLEPCGERKSRPLTCTQLILRSGIRRVVFAYREPDLFVRRSQGAKLLASAGLEVIELSRLADQVIAINSHLKLGEDESWQK
ncbi:MAG: deaminase [Candidatus Dormibacteraceae bacterium]